MGAGVTSGSDEVAQLAASFNVVGNAARFSFPGEPALVTVTQNNGSAGVSVRDTGPASRPRNEPRSSSGSGRAARRPGPVPEEPPICGIESGRNRDGY